MSTKQLTYFKKEKISFELQPDSVKLAQAQMDGIYRGVPLFTLDGKKIWLEHFSLSNPENFRVDIAKKADIVISCYPYYNGKRNSLTNMLFPNHRLRSLTSLEGNTLVVETDSKGNFETFLNSNPSEKEDFFRWANEMRNSLTQEEVDRIEFLRSKLRLA